MGIRQIDVDLMHAMLRALPSTAALILVRVQGG